MSALGQKRTFAVHKPMSALAPKATAKADSRKKVMSALSPDSGRPCCHGAVRPLAFYECRKSKILMRATNWIHDLSLAEGVPAAITLSWTTILGWRRSNRVEVSTMSDHRAHTAPTLFLVMAQYSGRIIVPIDKYVGISSASDGRQAVTRSIAWQPNAPNRQN